ncbi:MAG: phosphate/phosphite/phosphonate ABC transporter substrate-binding protein [Pseudomonadota bacterium]
MVFRRARRALLGLLCCLFCLNSYAAGEEAPLHFSVPPYDTPSRLIERYQPLVNYLSERLGRPVRLNVATSYSEQVRHLVNRSVDLAYMGPTSYIRAHDRYGREQPQRARLVAAESPYVGVIVVRGDSPIDSVAQLRGHTFAFGAHHSFASHYIPRAMMMRAGVSLADLTDYAYLGRHERVVLAVLHGDYDAAGTTRGIAEKYQRREPGLRILEQSPALPPLAVVARPGMDKGLFRRVRQALVEPGPQGLDALRLLGPAVSFSEAGDEDYALARAVVGLLERGCEDCPMPW